jgi:ribosome-associated protein
MLVVNDRLKIPLSELNFSFARSSGPGGQNVNKVNSKATLRWSATTSPSLPEPVRERFLTKYCHRITNSGEILISSQRFRDQGRNVADCLSKLRDMLSAVAAAPRKRKRTRPPKAAKERRLLAKRDRSEKKQLRRRPATDA